MSIGVPRPVPAPEVLAKDLLLDNEPFPPGWTVAPCEPYCKPGVWTAGRGFGIVGVPGHVLQDVYYMGDEKGARTKFRTYREAFFGRSTSRSPSTEFVPPPEITYRSPIADEEYLGCGVDVVPACQALIRYGSYVVYFYFDLDQRMADGVMVETDGGLTIEQVEPILRAMDERAAALLGQEAQSEEP